MSDFNPGEGWRMVPIGDGYPPENGVDFIRTQIGGVPTLWVREEPVPPLPTEPYTVILVTWRKPHQDAGESALMWDGHTWSADQVGSFLPGWLAKRITGFEVLAEPRVYTGNQYAEIQKARRETAKAVIGAIRAEGLVRDRRDLETLDCIAQDFEAKEC